MRAREWDERYAALLWRQECDMQKIVRVVDEIEAIHARERELMEKTRPVMSQLKEMLGLS